MKASVGFRLKDGLDFAKSNVSLGYRGRFVDNGFCARDYDISPYPEFISGDDIRMDEYHQGLYDELRAFLFEAVYTNPVAKAEEGKAKRVVGEMYAYFASNPGEMPPEYRELAESQDIHRAVCDYISGMSDRYCVSMYEKLFVPKSWSL